MYEIPTRKEMKNRIRVLENAALEAGLLQTAIRESEEKFRALADSMPSGVLLYQDDRAIYANPAIEKISGYAAEEIFNMHFWEVAHPDHKALIRERGRKRQRGEATVDRYEFKMITKNGRERWVDLSGASTMIGGRPAGVVSLADITDRKRMEEELRKSEEKYRLLAETLPDVIFTMDENLQITYMSPSITKLRGYTAEEAMAQSLNDILTPASLETAMNNYAREMGIEAQESGELHRTRTLELEERCKDGSTIWTETIFSAKRDKDNRFVGILGITRDITERKRAAEERERLIEERRRALSEIKVLSGMLPICSYCKKIRNDEGYWEHLENYISDHSDAEFTSGLCPDCSKKYFQRNA